MNSKSRGIGVWMASGAMVGALLGAATIGVFSNWVWIALGIPVGLAVGFGIGAARAFDVHTKKDKSATGNKTDDEGALPDSETCRAKQTTCLDYELVNCLIERPTCKFALSFGYGYFCRHPHRKEIVERTKALSNN